MSIQSEITRISGAKSDIADAIETKGVTVPTGSMIDDMADLILQIADSPELQAKTGITPIESSQTITADTGYYGLSSVQIDAIDSEYVGSDVPRNDSSDLTVSGATVSVPAGYYEESASKSVSSGSVTVNNVTISQAPTITVNSSGVVTSTLNTSTGIGASVTAGYVTSASNGTVYVNSSKTYSLATKAGEVYYPSSASDRSISSGLFLTGPQTIARVVVNGAYASQIRYGSIIKIGDSENTSRILNVAGTFTSAGTVSEGQTAATFSKILSGYSAWVDGFEVKGSIPSIVATTYTPGTSSQTLPQGYYLSGIQTIQGDANLIADNIADDTTIFGVTGNLERATPMTAEEILAAVHAGWV